MAREVSPSASIMPSGSILVGRDAELAQIEAWSADPISAPLIVTGPGGIGKTALVRAFVATRLDGRVVDCTACSSVDEVAIALATALDVDVVSARDRRLLVRRAKTLGVELLAFDNLERLAPASKDLVRLFSIVPRTLATSRIALGLPGERTMVLAPLATGDASAPAVEVLRRRGLHDAGRRVDPDEEAMLNEIAVLADGIPLALELAASQIGMFGVRWTAERLAEGLGAIDGGQGAEEGRTLRATFKGSWDLLPERERRAIARLSLFSGRFSLSEATRILDEESRSAAPSIVATLARHSWIVVDPRGPPRTSLDGAGDEPRFRLLVPLRELARRELARAGGEAAAAEALHQEIVLSVTEPASRLLRSAKARDAIVRVGRFYPDLLAIMTSERAGAEASLRAARATTVAAAWTLETSSVVSFREAAASPRAAAHVAAAPRAQRFAALVGRANVVCAGGQPIETQRLAEEALSIAESDEEQAAALLLVVRALSHTGDVEGAYHAALEVRELEPGPALACEVGLALAGTARWLGLVGEAEAAAREGVTAARAVGDVALESRLLGMLALLSFDQGDLDRAALAAREALTLVPEESGAAMFARAVLVDILVAKEEWDEADAVVEAIVRTNDESVGAYLSAIVSRILIRVRRGQLDEARSLIEAQAGKGEQLSTWVLVDALSAVVHAELGHLAKAERAAEAAYSRPPGTIETVLARAFLLEYELARLAHDADDPRVRGRVEATLELLDTPTGQAKSWIASSGDIRAAVASIRGRLSLAGFVLPAEREAPRDLLVESGGGVVRLGARSFTLKPKSPLRLLLEGLLESRDTELGVDRMFAIGWPGEHADRRAARNRVHVAVATLRRELLGESLTRTAAGYSLARSLRVVRR